MDDRAAASGPCRASRLDEVWACLDQVMDPELDEPITEMGFVEAVSITGQGEACETVDVSFRLPTYWCSPNFAFLMATAIRHEVERLPWVGRARVRLEDHMAAEEMNAAVNAGGAFSDVCRGLKRSRYKELDPSGDGMTLVDFLQTRTPRRQNTAADPV